MCECCTACDKHRLLVEDTIDVLHCPGDLERVYPSCRRADWELFARDLRTYYGYDFFSALKLQQQFALDKGCLKLWPLTDPTEIAVVFRHDSELPETSDFYIHYQMEQVAADTSGQKHVGYSNLAENAQYTRKLTGALQAWEWSTHHQKFPRNSSMFRCGLLWDLRMNTTAVRRSGFRDEKTGADG